MAQMKKHVGKITNTDQRCVVAMMEIPGSEGHALVIPTDSLPPRYEQVVRELVEGLEGQAEPLLANLLSRRRMPDNGLTVLQTLHEGGWLLKVPHKNLVMLPQPNMPFALSELVAAMKAQGMMPQARGGPANSPQRPQQAQRMELVEDADPVLAQTMKQMAGPVPEGESKFNPHMLNSMASKVEDAEGIARNLLLEAQMIEGDASALIRDANVKREKAYNLVPSLRPSAAVAPALPKVETTPEAGSKAVMALAAKKPRATTRKRTRAL